MHVTVLAVIAATAAVKSSLNESDDDELPTTLIIAVIWRDATTTNAINDEAE